MGQADGVDLAGYGSRVGATILDGLLVGVVAVLLMAVVAVSGDDLNYVVVGVALLASLVYAPVLMCRSGAHNGQTFGKQALGIRVVREDARPIAASTALMREFVGKGLLGLVPFFTFVDFLLPLGDPRRQAIHDKLASTFVVGADAVPDLEAAGPADPFGARTTDELPPSRAWAPPAPSASADWGPPAAEPRPAPPPARPEAPSPAPPSPAAAPSPALPPRAAEAPRPDPGLAPPAVPPELPEWEDDDDVRGPFGPSSN